ncbi:MAG: peptidoglycan DD-metalloendopeptidase family protein [Betaproteobacteria bacterium]
MNVRRVCALLIALGSCIASAAPRQDLDKVRGRLEVLQNELRETEESRAAAARQLRKSEKAISETNRRLQDLARQRETLEEQLADLQARRQDTETRIEGQRSEIGRMLRHQHAIGRSEPLRLALSRQDANRKARDLRYLTYISRARTDVMTGLRVNLRNLEELESRTQEQTTQLADVVRAQGEQKRALETEQQNRRKALATASAELARQRREYATLKKDEERLTQLVEKLARALAKPKTRSGSKKAPVSGLGAPGPAADGTEFGTLKGNLRLPVTGELGSRFGSPRGDDKFSRKGIFIRAAAGQEVKAVAAGRVVFADWLRGFGNLLIVDHGSGYMTLYGNNETLRRQPGDSVRAGDVIASVGSSGGQEETGLYFEMRWQGKPFDPLPWAPPR